MKSGWEEGPQLKAAWAVPLKMTKIKTLRATDGITLRGPRGPKNTNQLSFNIALPSLTY